MVMVIGAVIAAGDGSHIQCSGLHLGGSLRRLDSGVSLAYQIVERQDR